MATCSLSWFAHDVDGPFGDVQARDDAVEVDERHPSLHREPQTDVLVVPGIGPAVSVPQQAVFSESIVVRSRLAFDDGHSCDAEWHLVQDARLDSLRSHQGNSVTFVHEALLEDLTCEDTFVGSESSLFLQKPEGGEPDLRVDVVHCERTPILRLLGRLADLPSTRPDSGTQRPTPPER
jgi:hypothetical protein